MSRSIRRVLVPLVAFAAPVGLATACYGPTEVVIDITTDLGCDAPIRTAIYKGEPFLATPETETPSCIRGATATADAEIGTLTVLPSASRDGDAAVKAVLARGGKDPTACDADPTDCIVATRAFSFVAHTSRRVPMRLAKECLGTKCPDGQTCGAGGLCISNSVSCGGTDCVLAGDSDGGGDAGPDGGVIPSEAGVTVCGTSTSPPLVSNIPSPIATLALSDTILWYSVAAVVGSATSTTISQVPKQGGAVTDATVVPGRITGVGLANVDFALIGYQGVGSPMLRFGVGSKDVKLDSAATGFAKDSAGGELMATAKGIFRITLNVGLSSPAPLSPDVVHAMTSSKSGLYAVTDDSLEVFTPDQQTATGAVATTIMPAPKTTLLRSNGTGNGVFASVPSVDAPDDAMYSLAGAAAVPLAVKGHVSSFAADDNYLYVATGAKIIRYANSPAGASPVKNFIEAPPLQTIPHVLLDADCLYYWVDDGAGHVSLYSRGKDGK